MRLIYAAAIAAALLLCPPTSAELARADALSEEIESEVARDLDDNGVPGAALALVRPGKGTSVATFGTIGGSGEAVAPQTPFVTASISKSFTALAVMQLSEQGAIELDAPVSDYLPRFSVEPETATGLITVEMLLDQTSGIGETAGGEGLRYLSDNSIEETAKELRGTTLVSEPGEEWNYANGNYVLLGAIVESASGQSFEDWVTNRILEPLGMRHTFLELAPALDAGLGEGHRYWFGITRPHLSFTTGLVPAGGVISTAPDMARYMRMYLGGGALAGRRVLSRAGVETMMRPAARAEVGPWAKPGEVAYGYGLFVGGAPFGDEPAVFHPGGSPDSGSMMVLFPARDEGITLLLNASPEVPLPGADGAVDRISANAASRLIGSTPAEGMSMHDYYVWFDLIAGLLLACALTGLVGAARSAPRLPQRGPRRVLQILIPALALLIGLLALLPAVLGTLGWRVLSLSIPDLALLLFALAVLLAAAGAVRLLRIRSASRTARDGDDGSPGLRSGTGS